MNDYELLRALADPNQQDPVGNAAVEIVQELQKAITEQHIPWHDQELSNIVDEIIRKHLS